MFFNIKTTNKRNLKSRLFSESGAGFTLVEVLTVIGIMAVLILIIVSGFVLFQEKSDLNNAAEEIASVLKLAQSKTLGSQDDSRYGVYFDTLTSPDSFVLFKGSNYASREIPDKVYDLPDNVKFSDISFLELSGSEVVFDKLTGTTDNWGSVSLQLKTDVSSSKAVYASNLGVIGFEEPPVPEDTRDTDSRHVHVDYTRTIIFNPLVTPCTGETVDLYFDEAINPQEQIHICEEIVGGQFSWEGTVGVAGEDDQAIKIHTHWLNDSVNHPANPTQFCIHRDRRFNTVSLVVRVSGDSGTIAEYSADGTMTIIDKSIYASEPVWQ